jgi:tetratricopeptide (TPR) repeat protein
MFAGNRTSSSRNPSSTTRGLCMCLTLTRWGFIREASIAAAALALLLPSLGFCQPSNATAISNEADKALRERDYDLAIADYKKVLQIQPSSAAAWSNLGAAWFAEGNLAKAAKSFQRAARIQPNNSEYAFNTALALVREDQCDSAERYWVVAVRSPQHRPGALYLQGLCAFVSKNWRDAKGLLLNAEAGGNRTAETYYMLTVAARKSQDPYEAKRAFELLRSSFPDSSLLHELIAEVSDQDYMSADAEKEISLAISSSPDAPGLHAKLGFLLWKNHQLPEAQKLFEQELAIDPHSYSAMHFLGDIAERSSDFSSALDWDERALRERPESGEAHFAVGRVLELEGRSKDALKELRASFPELNDDASAHYWTARILKTLGMKEQAKLELGKVQEINRADRNVLLTKLNGNEP